MPYFDCQGDNKGQDVLLAQIPGDISKRNDVGVLLGRDIGGLGHLSDPERFSVVEKVGGTTVRYSRRMLEVLNNSRI